MITPSETLLKYDNPVLVTKQTEKNAPKDRPPKAGTQQSAVFAPVSPPPKLKNLSSDAIKQQTEEILDAIIPPRVWTENNKLWVQRVSSMPSTRADVIHLQEELDLKLRQRHARDTGICPARRELYTQCFDELIRQITINCAERGVLLLRVREEMQMTLTAYKTLYQSSVAFGMKKALQAERDKADMEKTFADLENENRKLQRQVDELNSQFEAFEIRQNERRQVDEQNYTEQMHFLRQINQQLKAQLDSVITSMR
ncbi:axonemal dynein light intermediate polypeptide 1-like [Clarias gariepinus]|uniref:axonemal dynein light intermediate polypeptide 1-like n=1 Tax=Clarias gariepinus TaxID=13013 RepID=UPI00234D3401|nr:axonemal dynein light intermediate polypeptide 1-like [Clarias gariepinus]